MMLTQTPTGSHHSFPTAKESPGVTESDACFSDAIQGCQLTRSRNQELAEEMLHDTRHHSLQHSLARRIVIVTTCTAAMIIHVSNSMSVLISLPLIGKTLDIPEDQLQWPLSAYSMSTGCLLLFFGRLADLHGRKKVFLIGMFWQMVLALGLGFTNNSIILDILRGFQGIGTAAAIPAALGILAHTFPPSRAQSFVFATFAAGAPLGIAFGYIIGGVLTQLSKADWRTQFFLSAALSALCVLGGLISLHPDDISSDADLRVDWIGAFLVTSSFVLILFALGQGPTAGWKAPYIISCLVIGIVLVGIFVVWEYHLEKSAAGRDKSKSIWMPPPLMKPSIWTRARGRMAVILAVTFLTVCGFSSWIFWVQLFYQNYLGLTPVLTMVRLIPVFVTGFLCNFFVGIVVSKLPFVVFFVFGTLIAGFASVLFALINPSAPYWVFQFPSAIMVVFGNDVVYSTGSILVANVVFPHEQSLAGGLFQTMIQIGAAFGLAISTIVFNSVMEAQSAKQIHSAGTDGLLLAELQGYKSGLWTSAAFAFFASLLAALFLRKGDVMGYGGRLGHGQSEQTIIERQEVVQS